MFERPENGERAVLVHVNFPDSEAREDLQEFTELVVSAGADIVATVTATRARPEPRLFVGQGKADEIHAVVKRHDADVVIFNHALSPSQERNLERLLSCRVLARTGLMAEQEGSDRLGYRAIPGLNDALRETHLVVLSASNGESR